MITLTTDFGYEDPFVGMMKGVILSINPRARISDISHGIAAHDILEAALAVGETYHYYPAGTIHVVVVDPGVGSSRRPLVVRAGRHVFVAPDNGVLSAVYAENRDSLEPRVITAGHYFLQSPGSTFDGRDVFAPVAAWLTRGIPVDRMGHPVRDVVTIHMPAPVIAEGRIRGQVLRVDRFGNAITNIRRGHLARITPRRVLLKNHALDIVSHYAGGDDGRPHALVNSSGRLEAFIYRGSASGALGLKPGDPVTVEP